MIVLHQFRPKFGVPNLSPFCLKVEAWLKIAELEYQVCLQDDPRKAPLGKLPSIVDDGKTVPDSSLILEYLSEKYAIDLDKHLSDADKAIAHAFQVMMEERLYWAIVYDRWLGRNWPKLKKVVFSVLPPLVRDIVPVIVQSQLRRDLHGHGLGRHDEETIFKFARRDIDALAQQLGQNHYFMGENISNIDAVLFAFLCSILKVELDNPLKEHARTHPNLVDYEKRMGAKLFPDYY